MNMVNTKREKGITLIALIVTIIVLLILAGITIASLTGDDGILTKSTEARDTTDEETINEQVNLAVLGALTMGQGKMDESNLRKSLNSKIGTEKYVLASDGNDGWIIRIKSSGKVFNVSSTGKIAGLDGESETDSKYFEYTLNTDTKTAVINGIKDKYAVKSYYTYDGKVVSGAHEYNCGIIDGDKVITDIVIPSKIEGCTVTEIGDYAFGIYGESEILTGWYPENDNMFTSFELPNTITKIGKNAFYGCTKVIYINIPDSVNSIGERAFCSCTSLTNIKLPSQITKIEKSLFYRCTKLQSVGTLSNVTSIGGNAFGECTNLNSINIPSTVTAIGTYAFIRWTSSQTINCQATSKPSGWSDYWYTGSPTINWNVSM